MKLLILGIVCILSSVSVVSHASQEKLEKKEMSNLLKGNRSVISGHDMLIQETTETSSASKAPCNSRACWDAIILKITP